MNSTETEAIKGSLPSLSMKILGSVLLTMIMSVNLAHGGAVEDEGTSAGKENQKSKLMSLPYLLGYNPAPAKTGVTVYDRKRAGTGVNLMVTGGANPAVLMDMEGNILHGWTLEEENHIRRAHLFPNGDLLAILGKGRLVKLDKDSKQIWYRKGGYHHDLEVAKNGDIYVLREGARTAPAEGKKIIWNLPDEFMDNFITVLTPDGEVKLNYSIFDCIFTSDYQSLLRDKAMGPSKGDILHANTIELVKKDSRHHFPPFREDAILVSFRHLDTIAIIDPVSRKVTWAASGMWTHQHQPTILADGKVLLFDNQGENGMSRVMEFDPATQEIGWAYRGTEENGFYSEVLGSQQRLPNGNTLITESCAGRVFEVTPENEIVWEYLNPQRAGPENDLIGVIYEMIRLNPDDFYFLAEENDPSL